MKFLKPEQSFGLNFDRGMILFEFDALREPEKTRFPQVGEWLRSRCEFNEIQTPKMLWRGKLWPDLYIANQLDAVREGVCGDTFGIGSHARNKAKWNDSYSLEIASIENHGEAFHAEFIEPMCRKISGRPSSEISAKYHRSIWLPLYWPETLRARQSLRTPFYYPRAGFAGAATAGIGAGAKPAHQQIRGSNADRVEIRLEFVTIKPLPEREFSVLFVVDDSPIYRITDLDVCAGIETEFHRWVVEFRGDHSGMQRLGLAAGGFQSCSFSRVQMDLPTLDNVKRGWKPRPNINEKLWEIMSAEPGA